MEFWAAAVNHGERVKVNIDENHILHLSQVSLGELKKDKGNESVCLFLHIGEEKLVLATLFSDKLPQQQLDLVFSKEFELSHNWKNGTVYFYGYKAESPFEDDEDDEFADLDSDSEEDIPLTRADNGKPETKVVKEEKPAETKKIKASNDSGAGKQKVKIVEPSPVKTDDDDNSSDEDDSGSDDEDDSTDEDEDESDSEGPEGSDDSEEEETPKKVESGKKRAPTSAIKTPQEKKAKLVTPQKTEGKKSGGHVATPYPTKGKTPAANKNPQTPKSAGSHSCKSCNKTFNSEAAIASHNKAKHSAGK